MSFHRFRIMYCGGNDIRRNNLKYPTSPCNYSSTTQTKKSAVKKKPFCGRCVDRLELDCSPGTSNRYLRCKTKKEVDQKRCRSKSCNFPAAPECSKHKVCHGSKKSIKNKKNNTDCTHIPCKRRHKKKKVCFETNELRSPCSILSLQNKHCIVNPYHHHHRHRNSCHKYYPNHIIKICGDQNRKRNGHRRDICTRCNSCSKDVATVTSTNLEPLCVQLRKNVIAENIDNLNRNQDTNLEAVCCADNQNNIASKCTIIAPSNNNAILKCATTASKSCLCDLNVSSCCKEVLCKPSDAYVCDRPIDTSKNRATNTKPLSKCWKIRKFPKVRKCKDTKSCERKKASSKSLCYVDTKPCDRTTSRSSLCKCIRNLRRRSITCFDSTKQTQISTILPTENPCWTDPCQQVNQITKMTCRSDSVKDLSLLKMSCQKPVKCTTDVGVITSSCMLPCYLHRRNINADCLPSSAIWRCENCKIKNNRRKCKTVFRRCFTYTSTCAVSLCCAPCFLIALSYWLIHHIFTTSSCPVSTCKEVDDTVTVTCNGKPIRRTVRCYKKQSHPDPERKYNLYYVDERGWVIKPISGGGDNNLATGALPCYPPDTLNPCLDTKLVRSNCASPETIILSTSSKQSCCRRHHKFRSICKKAKCSCLQDFPCMFENVCRRVKCNCMKYYYCSFKRNNCTYHDYCTALKRKHYCGSYPKWGCRGMSKMCMKHYDCSYNKSNCMYPGIPKNCMKNYDCIPNTSQCADPGMYKCMDYYDCSYNRPKCSAMADELCINYCHCPNMWKKAACRRRVCEDLSCLDADCLGNNQGCLKMTEDFVTIRPTLKNSICDFMGSVCRILRFIVVACCCCPLFFCFYCCQEGCYRSCCCCFC